MGVLIKDAIATDLIKKEFVLRSSDFQTNSIPAIKTVGLGAGDSVTVYEDVDGEWQAGKVLDVTVLSTIIRSVGKYAVDITMSTAGPVTVMLDKSYS